MVYLREGTGQTLEIREHSSSAPPDLLGEQLAEFRRRNETMTRVYMSDSRYDVWLEDVGWFFVDRVNPSISVPRFSDREWVEAVMWGLPMSLLLLDQGDIVFHASAVEINGRAFLFAAPGGHGKTSLAGALMAGGHRLLAEDLIRCNLGSDPSVFPGPALIRLRRDVASQLTIPGTYKVTDDPEKIHLGIEPHLRGDGTPVPFGALVFLHRGDAIALEKTTDGGALADIWAVTLNLPTPQGRSRCFQQIADISSTVPIWRLTRPLTWESLPKVIELLEQNAYQP